MTTGNQTQQEAWNGDSGHRWAADANRRDRVLQPVATAILAAADPQAGQRVLDIGCGCGATTLAAARTLGPQGTAHGIDLSGPMLDVARRRCAAARLANVEFVEADVQTDDLPGGSDLAISRFGTMFFSDPIAAFANVAHALGPGGRICFATWQPLLANDWLTIPGAALLGYATMPSAGEAGPGMFAQSEPDLVRSVLTSAGFEAVDFDPVSVDLPLGARPADAVDFLTESGVGRTVLDTVPPRDRPSALAAVEATLAEHATPAGIHLGAAIWIITARVHAQEP